MEKVVFTFGRLNPPTVGHEKLVDKVKQLAQRHNAEPHVFLSHSQNAKKDPLSYQQKLKYAKQSFGDVVYRSNARTIIEIMKELEKMNHKQVIMVVGSDRVQEFRALLNRYNGKDFTFKKITVVSAGERDPDAEGVSGMSASKMRAAASQGDAAAFMRGVPSRMSAQNAKRMYNDLRSAMNIREDWDSFDWDHWAETVDVDEVELLDEAVLSFAQRIKRARQMKRLAPRFKNLRRIKKFRMADKDRLMKRARKQAIQLFRKKVAGDKGEHYSQLSPAAKISIDKLIQKKLPAVSKLAQRLLPRVRKAEIERIRKLRSAKNEQVEEGNKAQLGIPANATNAQLRKIRSSDSSSKEQKQRAHWLLNMRKEEVAQDPDIKDRKGTQPKKYFKDLSKSTKAARDAHFKKYADKDDKDPANYKPAPGDKSAETKPSKHTKKYNQMFGEAVKIGDKTYQDLELCGDAVKVFKRDIADDSLDKDKVQIAARAVDKYLSVERRALKNKFASPSDMKQFKELQAIAKQKIRDAGLKGHDYHDYHLKTMLDLSKKIEESNGQTDDVADIVPDRMRFSMISASKKKLLNDKFENMINEAMFKVDIEGLPSMYVDAPSAMSIKGDLRKLLKKPEKQITDITRVTPSEVKKVFRDRAAGKFDDGDDKDINEQDIAARVSGPSTDQTAQRHAAEKQRLRDKQKRERDALKSRQDGQKNRAQIRDIRSESLDEAFEQAMSASDRLAKRLKDKHGYDPNEREKYYADMKKKFQQTSAKAVKSEEPMQRRQQKGSSSIAPRDNYTLEEKAIDALKKKAEKSGIPYGTLKRVYDRGMAAWKSGHRPGTTPQQWAFARVNSFVTKSKGTWGGADKDLASKVKSESVAEAKKIPHALDPNKSLKHAMTDVGLDRDADGDVDILDKMKKLSPDEITGTEKNTKAIQAFQKKRGEIEKKHTRVGVAYEQKSLDEAFQMHIQQPAGYGQMVTAKDAGIEIQAGFAMHPSVSEAGGAGEWGTDKLVKKYKQDTPGETVKEEAWLEFESCCEDCMEQLQITEAEYEGKTVKLNDPIRTSENPKKKFKVYVRDPSSGNIKVVRFGDPGLSIKRDDPGRRRNFRARHNCENPGPITKARYWSCRMWSKKNVSDLD